MAFTFGTPVTNSVGGIVSAVSVGITVSSNPKRCLIAIVSYQDTTTITSCKLDTVSMTSIARASRNFTTTQAFYLVAPASGAGTVVATLSGASSYPMITVYEVDDVEQTSPIDGTATGTGTASPVTVGVTTSVANSVVLDGAGIQTDTGDITLTVGAGQTTITNYTNASQERQATSRESTTTPTTVTMSWTESANRNWSQVAFGLKLNTAVDVTVLPSTLSATFSQPTTSASIGVAVTPSAQSGVFSIPSATIFAGSDVVVSAGILGGLFSLYSPTLKISTSWTDKHGAVSTSWSDKHADPATSWTDKITPPSTIWGDKY